eukprot:scaffold14600_cov37-Phaeocystis_antarctica.AAC.2
MVCTTTHYYALLRTTMHSLCTHYAPTVQESQMHAADIAGILDERENIIGGRDAMSGAEFQP